MFRNPTDNIHSVPVTCLYGKLSEDEEMPLESKQGSHNLK